MATSKKVTKQVTKPAKPARAVAPATTPAAKLNAQAKPVAVVPKQAPAKGKPKPAQAAQAPAPVAPAVTLQAAQQANAGISLANGIAHTNGGQALVKPSQRANSNRRRVYGYGNVPAGGGVPKQAYITLQGAAPYPCPNSVAPASWAALVAYVQANPNATVQQVYAAGLTGNTGRTVRRAWRKGAIGFSATPVAQAAKPAAKAAAKRKAK